MWEDSPVVAGLTDRQREAVLAEERACLVLAGAGSGKTRVITHRIAHLVRDRGVSPASILAVTFTNKAAGEMKARAAALLGGHPEAPPRVWISTFHSFCLRALRRHAGRMGLASSFLIFDEGDQQSLVRAILREQGLTERTHPARRVLGWISHRKSRGLALEAEGDEGPALLSRVAQEYRRRLGAAGALDFDDLLLYAVELLDTHADVREAYQRELRWILVDEYQDTNRSQYELVRLLAGAHGNVMAVGDEDQSIYSWRGADINNILSFERDFPGARIFRLEENFRSAQPILDAAAALVSHNLRRHEKVLRATRLAGEPVVLYTSPDEYQEGAWVAERANNARRSGRVAVLFRTNAQSRVVEEALLRLGAPYVVIGGLAFYERREIKDALAYLRLLVNPRDVVAFRRVANVPPRGLGERSLDVLLELARARGVDVWEAGRLAAEEGLLGPRAVLAMTSFSERMREVGASVAALGPQRVLERVLEVTGYARYLEEESHTSEERLGNLAELISAATDFERREGEASVAAFLDHVSLLTAADQESGADAVRLMTLHAAKGLEFETVFLIGLEEGLLPHGRTLDNEDQLEEERRLCYVGMTRARDRLYLTRAMTRHFFGRRDTTLPSRFLHEIPAEQIRRQGVGLTVERPSLGWHPETPRPEARPIEGASDFRPGHRVRHALFGVGTILRVDGTGHETKLTVAFPGATKRLVARYAGLEPL